MDPMQYFQTPTRVDPAMGPLSAEDPNSFFFPPSNPIMTTASFNIAQPPFHFFNFNSNQPNTPAAAAAFPGGSSAFEHPGNAPMAPPFPQNSHLFPTPTAQSPPSVPTPAGVSKVSGNASLSEAIDVLIDVLRTGKLDHVSLGRLMLLPLTSAQQYSIQHLSTRSSGSSLSPRRSMSPRRGRSPLRKYGRSQSQSRSYGGKTHTGGTRRYHSLSPSHHGSDNASPMRPPSVSRSTGRSISLRSSSCTPSINTSPDQSKPIKRPPPRWNASLDDHIVYYRINPPARPPCFSFNPDGSPSDYHTLEIALFIRRHAPLRPECHENSKHQKAHSTKFWEANASCLMHGADQIRKDMARLKSQESKVNRLSAQELRSTFEDLRFPFKFEHPGRYNDLILWYIDLGVTYDQMVNLCRWADTYAAQKYLTPLPRSK